MSIFQQTRREVAQRLQQVESGFDVHIIYACESGSRAWGFPSATSDFDVRFLYVHRRNWYLSVLPKRNVIEIPIVDDYDLSGWDIRKTLFLLYKSNPALLEWLSCPIVYREDAQALVPLRKLISLAFNPTAAFHHYLSMAGQHITRMSTGSHVKIKHYLYTIRPILACRWVLDRGAQPPMIFQELVDTYLPAGPAKQDLAQLMDIKRQAEEVKTVPRVPSLDELVEAEYGALRSQPVPEPVKPDIELFDQAFRKIIDSCG